MPPKTPKKPKAEDAPAAAQPAGDEDAKFEEFFESMVVSASPAKTFGNHTWIEEKCFFIENKVFCLFISFKCSVSFLSQTDKGKWKIIQIAEEGQEANIKKIEEKGWKVVSITKYILSSKPDKPLEGHFVLITNEGGKILFRSLQNLSLYCSDYFIKPKEILIA